MVSSSKKRSPQIRLYKSDIRPCHLLDSLQGHWHTPCSWFMIFTKLSSQSNQTFTTIKPNFHLNRSTHITVHFNLDKAKPKQPHKENFTFCRIGKVVDGNHPEKAKVIIEVKQQTPVSSIEELSEAVRSNITRSSRDEQHWLLLRHLRGGAGYFWWKSFVKTFCKNYLWKLLVTTFGDNFCRKLFVKIIPENVWWQHQKKLLISAFAV